MFTKHYTYFRGSISEGGNSRNFAIAKLAAQDGADQRVFSRSTRFGRFMDGIFLLARLMMDRNEVILVHYSLFPTLFSKHIVSLGFVSKTICRLLASCALRNTIYVEVNDLPYEQAIDLELPSNKMNVFDLAIFSQSGLRFIFASIEMGRYTAKKYGVNEINISYLVNGSWEPTSDYNFPSWYDPDRSGLKFVYAGTLNKGRQIEALVNLFVESDHSLVLVGTGGDWINVEFENFPNILYFGSFIEEIAQKIVEKCDVGVIPYDENRFYYNISFPTKASFYVVSGVPFLATPLTELQNHFSNDDTFFVPFSGWADFLADPHLSKKIKAKQAPIINRTRDKFHWEVLWRRWIDQNVKKVS